MEHSITRFPPSIAPAPSGWIEAIWRATRPAAGENRLTWDEAQSLQNAAMPLCPIHQLRTSFLGESGAPFCLRCLDAETQDEPRLLSDEVPGWLLRQEAAR